ncbi:MULTISPECIES: hypothetical protein [unclassified Luteococcus]|uniref:hypothetical protein n=1 Tax=unclassified Luteococcus TaxID=2639923 RepID=UPI00313E6121
MSSDQHHAAATGGLWQLDDPRQVAPRPDVHGHTPRTEQVTHEAAAVERIPVDAQNLGLTDLTAPGLAMATSLNPDRRRHRIVARIALALFILPALVQVVLVLLEQLR